MKEDFMFTSESVTEGHPDKLCDQISDAIVEPLSSARQVFKGNCRVRSLYINSLHSSKVRIQCSCGLSEYSKTGYQSDWL